MAKQTPALFRVIRCCHAKIYEIVNVPRDPPNDMRLTSSQPNRIELTIHRVPPAITNITTVNGQAVSLSPGAIMLSNPVHAEGIVVSRLHLLLLVDIGGLGVCHLLGEDFGASLTIGAEGGLHDAEVRKAADSWLLLDDVRLLSV